MGDEMNIFDDHVYDMEVNNGEELFKQFLEDETDDNEDLEKEKLGEDEDPEKVGKEGDDKSEGDDTDDGNSPNIFSSLSEVFVEQGLLPSLESPEKIKDVDSFVSAFQKEIQNQSQVALERYLENLDLNSIAESKKSIMELDSINEDYLKENLDKAKELIKTDLLNQKLPEEKANRLLKKIIDLGEESIIEEALESKENIKNYNSLKEKEIIEQRKIELENERIEAQKIEEKIKSIVLESKEIIPGVKNTPAFSQSLLKSMNEVVAKNPQTGELENAFTHERSKDPITFDIRMYAAFLMTKGFTDLSSIFAKEKTNATKRFEKVLRQTKFEDNGLPSFMQDNESYDGFGSQLVL